MENLFTQKTGYVPERRFLMLAIFIVSQQLGEYQRPYLTIFRISYTPDLSHLVSLSDFLKSSEMVKLDERSRELSRFRHEFQKSIIANNPSEPGISIEEASLRRIRLEAAQRGFALADEQLNVVKQEKDALFAARNDKNASPELLRNRYPIFEQIQEHIDIYSLKTAMPDRKSQMNEFW
jgi:hypothetical protein